MLRCYCNDTYRIRVMMMNTNLVGGILLIANIDIYQRDIICENCKIFKSARL